MSSPFSTIEEFNGALDGPTEGAIYTFANAPAINVIALLVAVGIFFWFLVATYTTHPDEAPSAVDKSINRLSSFIVIGLLSLIAADYRQTNKPVRTEQGARHTAVHSVNRAAPLGLLGMISTGAPGAFRRTKRKRDRREAQRRVLDSRHRRR